MFEVLYFSEAGGKLSSRKGSSPRLHCRVSRTERLCAVVGKSSGGSAYLAWPGRGASLFMETITAYSSEMPAAAAVLCRFCCLTE